MTALYPVIALIGLRYFDPIWVTGFLAVLVLLRVLFGKGGPLSMAIAPLCAVAGMAVMMLYDSELALRFYPVFMGVAILTAFAHSLFSPPSLIEVFARMRDPDLTPEGVLYTRRVTIAWTIFLTINTIIAFYIAVWQSMEVWAFYNGFLSYVFMGVMFVGEVAIRRTISRRSGKELVKSE